MPVVSTPKTIGKLGHEEILRRGQPEVTGQRFSIRKATGADRADIIRLISEMHGADITQRFDRLYRGNPHGEALTWIAVDNESGSVAAVTSIFPRDVLVNGRLRRGAIGGDCYVAPHARLLGLATQLHMATRSQMRSSGVEFTYGPPLTHNLRALVNAGSTEVTVFSRYIRPLTSEFFCEQIVRRLPRALLGLIPNFMVRSLGRLSLGILNATSSTPDRGYTVSEAGLFDDSWDEWIQMHAPRSGICGVRDSAYMNFRYPESERAVRMPYLVRRDGALSGMFVLERSSDGATASLVDLFAPHDLPSLRACLGIVIGMALEGGFGKLVINATPYPPLVRALRAEGFLQRDQNSPSIFQVLSSSDEQQTEELIVADAWYFLNGDQDMGAGF